MKSFRINVTRLATLHPILFAVYPMLFLYARNADEFPPSVVVAPILISVTMAVALWRLLYVFFRDTQKSGAIVALFVLMFFSYGHFYRLMENSGVMRIGMFGDQKVVLGLYALLLLIAAILCARLTNESLRQFTPAVVAIGIFLVAVPVFQISVYFFRIAKTERPPVSRMETLNKSIKNLPDIYYIILDGYPRADLLEQIHEYNNDDFLNYLKSKGFYIAEKSLSNYPGTSLSIASSLNFQYVEDLVSDQGTDSTNRWPLTERIKNNAVCEFLRKQGYKIVAFDSGYFPTEIKNADRFLASGWVLNEFHNAIIDSTPASVWLKNFRRYSLQRKRILFILDHLSDVISPDSPSFVFAHVMALHPPFVFGPNGEQIAIKKSSFALGEEVEAQWEQRYKQAFHGQLTFINRKMKTAVEKILNGRVRPAVLILQADHGSSSTELDRVPENLFYKERFSILNAYYFPDPIAKNLYPGISPVNTFRLLFDHYFQTNLGLLNDENFYSERKYPYRFLRVTEKIPR